MKLTKSTFSKVDEFMKLFHNKNFKYKVKFDTSGNIISLETTDQSIIKYAKDIGLTEE